MSTLVSETKKYSKVYFCLILTFAVTSCVLSASEFELDSQNDGPLLIDESRLAKVKEQVDKGDTLLFNIRQNIIEKAEKHLDQEPLSVVSNGELPVSGNPHDYRSIARYWWPNFDTENGLPYVYKDGEPNPEIHETDWSVLSKFSASVWNLSLAYYFTGNEKYARKAKELLRYWFINEDTYMAPHLKYGQAIPGIREGTPSGIIETTALLNVIDGVSLIYGSRSWTKNDHIELKAWFSSYLDWLLYSSFGAGASNQENNHSTWFEVQAGAYALFVGREDVARRRSREVYSNKIQSQINFDGAQPQEIIRVNSQSYVTYNLLGIINMVILAKNADAGLLGNNSGIIQRVKNGLDWLKPFATGEKNWPFKQQDNYNRCQYVEIYRKAAIEFNERLYEDVVQNLIKDGCSEVESILLHPKPDFN